MYTLSFLFFLFTIFSFFLMLAVNYTSPISSLLFLLVLFVISFFLLIEVDLEFLALLLLLVYVGAVFVLFLFCIMMMSSSSIVDLRAKRSFNLVQMPFEGESNMELSRVDGRYLFFRTFSIFLFVFLGFDVGVLFFFDPFFIVSEADILIDYSASSFDAHDIGFVLYTAFFFVLGALAFVLLFGLLSVLVIISPF